MSQKMKKLLIEITYFLVLLVSRNPPGGDGWL